MPCDRPAECCLGQQPLLFPVTIMAMLVEYDVVLEVPLVDTQAPGFAIMAGNADLVALLIGDRCREIETALIDDVVQGDKHAVDQPEVILVLQADDLFAA